MPKLAGILGKVRGREGETRRRQDRQRGAMQRKMQSAMERETREGGIGFSSRGAARQGGEDRAHRGALRDRPEAIRQVRH